MARSVIRRIYASQGPTLVGGILGLSKGLGLRPVAEGVEDLAAWERLRSTGFDLMQGTYLCRPLLPDELVAWLTASHHMLAESAS